MKKLNSYDVLSITIILIILVVTLLRYDIFPIFVDIYYHTSVALSFDKAGGIVLWDFWEFAPEGRPHLYPPFLHCLMLLLQEVATPVSVGKFISFIMFPASQMTVWLFSREVFSRKCAFYSLLLLSSSLEYFRLQAVTSAAALVLVLVPLMFYAFEKGKYLAATIVLTLCLYTHVGMGPIALGSFALYSIFCREKLKEAVKVIVLSLVLYIPWVIHLIGYSGSLSSNSPASGGSLMLFPWFFGIIGFFICTQRKKEFLIPVCIFICMIPVAFTYFGRFTGHSILPLSLLSGVALSQIDERLTGKQKMAFVIGAFIVLILVAPTIGLQKERKDTRQVPHAQGSRIGLQTQSLMTALPRMQSDSYLTFDNVKMAEIIRRNSQENEIVFIPGGIMGCFVTAMTGRPQTLGMWQEVAADFEPDPKSASLFVMLKGKKVPSALTRIGETEKWVVLRAPEKKTVTIPRAVVKKEIVYLVMAIALAASLYDFFLRKRVPH